MRKQFLLFIILIFSGILNAQTMSVGPEFGMNLIRVEKQDIGDDYQPGWYGGAIYDYKIFDWFSIRPGITYSQSRQAYNYADTTLAPFLSTFIDSSMVPPGLDLNTYTTAYGRRSLHYLQIPIQANFSWKNIQLSVGGYFGFLLGARQRELIIEETPIMSILDIESIDSTGFISSFLPAAYEESTSNTTGTDGLRIFDYGLKAGLGYQFDRVGMRASYSFGLSDYRSPKSSPIVRNQYFQLSVYYLFPLSGKESSSSIR